MMKKNILIFMHNDATQFVDIANQYTKLFDSEKYAVTLVYLSSEQNEATRKRSIANEVIFLNFSRRAIRGLKLSAIRKMISFCREKQFEVVICHRYKPSYILLWVAQFVSIPVLFFVMHELGTMKSFARKSLIAALMKKNMIFAGVSNAVRDDIRRNLLRIPPERVITLYNSMDTAITEPQLLTREAARTQLTLPQDAFIWGNIGRLAKNKDQTTLLHAFAKIKPFCEHAKLVIIGDGQLEKELKQLTETLHIQDSVFFTGFVPEAFRLMKAFDGYISSSIQEAFGMVLLEAMIARLPIIATRVNGVPEVIGESGILIDAANVDQLANAMRNQYALSPAKRAEWSEKSYTRVQNDFSLTRFKEIFWKLPFLR